MCSFSDIRLGQVSASPSWVGSQMDWIAFLAKTSRAQIEPDHDNINSAHFSDITQFGKRRRVRFRSMDLLRETFFQTINAIKPPVELSKRIQLCAKAFGCFNARA